MPALATVQQSDTVHLFPKHDGWILVAGDRGHLGKHFPDLGRALDAATTGDKQVHVVVHERSLSA